MVHKNDMTKIDYIYILVMTNDAPADDLRIHPLFIRDHVTNGKATEVSKARACALIQSTGNDIDE